MIQVTYPALSEAPIILIVNISLYFQTENRNDIIWCFKQNTVAEMVTLLT